MACLVQQLFRQKIGQEMDTNLFENHMFPLLLKERKKPCELLQDIVLTRKVHTSVPLQVRNISPFTKVTNPPDESFNNLYQDLYKGKWTSTRRRELVSNYRDWGTIEILNQLRELKRPETPVYEEGRDSRREAYIILNETNEGEMNAMALRRTADIMDYRSRPTNPPPAFRRDRDLFHHEVRCLMEWDYRNIYHEVKLNMVQEEREYVNNFLEDALVSVNFLSLDLVDYETKYQPILSIESCSRVPYMWAMYSCYR
jgi:hypothetical protein